MTLFQIAQRNNIDINYLIALLGINNIIITDPYESFSDERVAIIQNIINWNFHEIENANINNHKQAKKKRKQAIIVFISVFVFLFTFSIILVYNPIDYSEANKITPSVEFDDSSADIYAQTTAKTPETKLNVTTTKKPIVTTAPVTKSPTIVTTTKAKINGEKKVDFKWSNNNTDWNYSMSISNETYQNYKSIDRNNFVDNYSSFVTDPNDDEWLRGIVDKFKQEGAKNGYSDYDVIKLLITFVQSLNYIDDKASTGYDEYPKYPLETLYDKGGDCEDTSILLASLIREMGYGVVMLEFEDHMAVGIQGTADMKGTYFEYNSKRYYYIETTNTGWKIGEIPDDYANKKAKILPLN